MATDRNSNTEYHNLRSSLSIQSSENEYNIKMSSLEKSNKQSKQPLLVQDQSGSYNALDINIHNHDEHDPLLRQLPNELREFVVRPEDNQDPITYVERGPIAAFCHVIMAILLNCYSLCRMIVVQQGQIALTQYGDQQELLGPGRHVLLSPWNRFIGIRNITDSVIRHGPIHIIRVEVGQLGYGVDMEHGKPVLLSRGKHVIRSNTFVWKKFITLRERRTVLDQIEIIRVETGNVGYSYRQGKLVILPPGLHLIEPPDRFGNIVSTQMSILDLPLATHETSDYVPLGIKAAVFYRISDPYKALVRIQNVSQQILETSVATLAGIIRSSSLSDVASRSQPFYHQAQSSSMPSRPNKLQVDSKEDELNDNIGIKDSSMYSNPNDNSMGMGMSMVPPSAPPFFQHVHDEFIQSLHDHVLDEWGVEIQNIRIESLKIDDTRLQKDISAQAIDVSKQHNQYIMLQKKQEIVTVEAETRAARVRIDTSAETNKIRQQAQADADAMLIRAKAQKIATELKGQGEAEYARLLESTKLGRDLAAMKIQADALSGLQQVAYVPHLNGLLSNGQGVFSANSQLLMPLGKDQ